MLVGFKRATIGIFDGDGSLLESHVIEGKKDEGATSTANITGLASEAVRVAGSDIVYYMSQRGTGEVSVDLGIIDLPTAVNDAILGYRQTESKIAMIGNSTEPPYCALLLESSDLKGEKALLGFFKGKFTKDAIDLETLDPTTPYEPAAESLVFNAINDDKEGESKGEVLGKYVGTDETAITELRNLVLPGEVPAG